MFVTASQLVYEYPNKTALKNVSFSLEQGSITALVGPNGAGKTTLLRCIAALEMPFSGEVYAMGHPTHENPRVVHENLGFMADNFGIYSTLSILQCLTYAGWSRGLQGAKLKERLKAVIALLKLEEYVNVRAGTLSRGWKQRLGIAQAIIHQPKLLLLDEPASGLDPEARVSLSQLFKKLQKEGATLVVSSHILAELEDYCTSMLVLREGRLVETTSLQTNLTVQEIIVSLGKPSSQEIWNCIPHLHKILIDTPTILRLFLKGGETERQEALNYLISQGVSINEFAVVRERLQNIYLATIT